MEDKLKNTILFSCENHRYKATEQLVTEHILISVVSGKIELQFCTKTIVLDEGDIALIRRNELVKTQKIPGEHGLPFKSASIVLPQELLRLYANRNKIAHPETYVGGPIHILSKNSFIKTYFDSLLPYFQQPHKLSTKMAALKSEEAVELLLDGNLEKLLFDFSEPFKIDLEKFMNQNFIYNISVSEFARLTGRSLSTFKRDFKAIYNDTPEKWLRERRLKEAQLLIMNGQKPTDVYYNVGFKNLSHFSLAYKQKFGHNASAR